MFDVKKTLTWGFGVGLSSPVSNDLSVILIGFSIIVTAESVLCSYF
jgi:hypothetical protein